MRNAQKEQVGIWNEKVSRKDLHRYGEYAGAGETHTTKPGEYPVMFYDRNCFTVNIASHYKSWFQNRIGSSYGQCKEETGEGSYPVQLSAFGLAKAVRRGVVTLTAAWVIQSLGNTYADGSPVERVVRACEHCNGPISKECYPMRDNAHFCSHTCMKKFGIIA